jgi:hypothetical protein
MEKNGMSTKRSLWLLYGLLASALALCMIPGAGLAQTKLSATSAHVYIPLLDSHVVPRPLTPEDNQRVISLAPILSWSPIITGTFRIQVSPDPAFPPINTLPLSETKTLTHIASQETLISSNLTSRTVYYWRVGVKTPAGVYSYARTRTFTTPPKDAALLPPIVPLVAPADHQALPGTSVLLQWQNVPDALYYRVRVFDANGVLFSAGSKEVASPTNSLEVTGLQPGMAYTWKVKALNAYGWGEYGAEYHFSVP